MTKNVGQKQLLTNIAWINLNTKGERNKIDIELNISGKIHYIEVKTTTESVNSGETLKFFMSCTHFEAATNWGRDTNLIFVVGINDPIPKLLYFNFNDNWLNSFWIIMVPTGKSP